jgi:hypothetical protein
MAGYAPFLKKLCDLFAPAMDNHELMTAPYLSKLARDIGLAIRIVE